MTYTPRIVTSFHEPPIPAPGFWTAYDDKMGADASPYGQGATEAEAISDLRAQLADMMDAVPERGTMNPIGE